jgi:hypothetical protein
MERDWVWKVGLLPDQMPKRPLDLCISALTLCEPRSCSWRFLEAMECTILSGHRIVPAFGLAGGRMTDIVNGSASREIDAAFASLAHERPDALFVAPDAFFNSRRVPAHNRIPASYANRVMPQPAG